MEEYSASQELRLSVSHYQSVSLDYLNICKDIMFTLK